jgi:hypothetical protein
MIAPLHCWAKTMSKLASLSSIILSKETTGLPTGLLALTKICVAYRVFPVNIRPWLGWIQRPPLALAVAAAVSYSGHARYLVLSVRSHSVFQLQL